MQLRQGEVLALLGANGAGKSTLIRVLSGVQELHAGSVRVDSQAVRLSSAADARRIGVETVHQRVGEQVVPGLSVAENLVLDEVMHGGHGILVRRNRILARAREVEAGLALGWSDRTLRSDVARLSISDQQMLLLARAVSRDPRVLILDEPTSALSFAESERLFEVVRGMRDRGLSVVFVSHRLGEIDSLADRIVVLRDGRVQLGQSTPFDWRAALEAMLGSEGAHHLRPAEARRGTTTVVQVRGAVLRRDAVPQDLDIRGGEVLGVAGLIGAGKSELVRGLFGADPMRVDEVTLDGKSFSPKTPGDAVRAGVYMVPEDRAAEAIVPGWSVAGNISLPFLRAVSRRGILKRSAERSVARDVIEQLGVVAASETADIATLSGGNQQKVVVGRWLVHAPRVLLLDEPFRGVDVGARRDLAERARALAASGVAVVVLSADVDEVLEVADRVVVLVDGEIRLDSYADTLPRSEVIDAMSEVVG